MASDGKSGARIAIQIVLAVLILALGYVLFISITRPYNEFKEQERQTTLTRERMDDVRTSLIAYRDANNGYPATLDSLVLFARADSALMAQAALVKEENERRQSAFAVDSLPFSPRTGTRFNYEVVSDTTETVIYWLQDPDVPGDSIGSRRVDPAQRNAASWE
jgi:hypothetical protein